MYNKNLYLCVISAKSSEGREEVARHLRYWPYVKFFKYQGDRHLLCCFCLGEAKDGYQLKQLYERSRQLVLLCLRQYDVTITRWKPLPDDFKLIRNNRLFTRPDSNLKPFITFMGDAASVSGTAKVIPLTSKGTKETKTQVLQMTVIPMTALLARTKVDICWKNIKNSFLKFFKETSTHHL